MLLKGWMAKTGTGLEELAKKADISVSYLCNIQNGKVKAKPKPEVLARLARATGLDLRELTEDTERLIKENGTK